MKSGFGIAVAAIAVFLLLSVVSVSVSASPLYNTIIAGKVYDGPNFETAQGVLGATVHITCVAAVNVTKDATTLSDGTYSIQFLPADGCLNTYATAYAEKNGVTSPTQTSQIQDYTGSFQLYLGVINIAMIPEFGVVAGAVTLLSAVGIFFFIRKR